MYERLRKKILAIVAKYSVAMVMGFLKGKSAVRIHRCLLE